jgi:phospholipase C
MNVTNMPGFTAEASIYRTRSYRETRVDGVSDAFEAVEAAQSRAALIRQGMSARNINETFTVADFYFETAFRQCWCNRAENWCSCFPRPITA